jgi:hypothetical protein
VLTGQLLHLDGFKISFINKMEKIQPLLSGGSSPFYWYFSPTSSSNGQNRGSRGSGSIF